VPSQYNEHYDDTAWWDAEHYDDTAWWDAEHYDDTAWWDAEHYDDWDGLGSAGETTDKGGSSEDEPPLSLACI
jgi:hypothetical protein